MAYRSRDEYRRLGLIHRWNTIAAIFLLASGLLLYAEPLRGLLAPIRVPLKYLHITAGFGLILWAVGTVTDWGSFLVRRGLHLGRRLNTILTALWLIAWTGTGVLMWLRGAVDYRIADLATTTHDWLTWLAIPWITLHTAFRLSKVRRLDEKLTTEQARERGYAFELSAWLAHPATRRAVLWTGFGALALILGGRWFRPITPESLGGGISELPPEPPVDPKTLPGGGLKGRFRLYFVTDRIPKFDPAAWKLTVGKKPYSWEQFQALPRTQMVSNFHCVTGWSVFDITWEGVRLRDLLADAGVGKAPVLIFQSGDGVYTDSLTWEQALSADVMLAYRMDGRSLPIPQGGPVRLLVPQMYGYKSVKWVEGISASDQTGYTGYWEDRGYARDAYLAKREPVRGSQDRSSSS